MSDNRIFHQRHSHHYDELRKLYLDLFHDEHAFEYFLSMLEKMYDQRSEELRQWDQKRCGDPNWYRRNDILGTLMYVDCFRDNLQALKKKGMCARAPAKPIPLSFMQALMQRKAP